VERKVRYVCDLFNDLSASGIIGSNVWIIPSNEWEGIWKEAVVAQMKVLSQQLPGGTQKYKAEPYSSQYMISQPSFEPDIPQIEITSVTIVV
jgi:hypothetical protein